MFAMPSGTLWCNKLYGCKIKPQFPHNMDDSAEESNEIIT